MVLFDNPHPNDGTRARRPLNVVSEAPPAAADLCQVALLLDTAVKGDPGKN